MKHIVKKIIQIILLYLAKIYILRVRPVIVVISGSSNRLTFKNVIADKFLVGHDIRVSPEGYNAELGLPLSVLGLKVVKKKDWLTMIPKAIFSALLGKRVKTIFLELGINRPGDMAYMLKIIQPDVVVLTNIEPVYMENFVTLDNIALEYEKLIQNVKVGGSCVLNFDDERLKNISKNTTCGVHSFSLNSDSDNRARNIVETNSGAKFVLGGKDLSTSVHGDHYILAEVSANIIYKILNS